MLNYTPGEAMNVTLPTITVVLTSLKQFKLRYDIRPGLLYLYKKLSRGDTCSTYNPDVYQAGTRTVLLPDFLIILLVFPSLFYSLISYCCEGLYF